MADAEELTRRWLADCVLALELCPFAAPVLRDDTLRIAVSSATSANPQLRDFLAELDHLQAREETEISTTLLVYEHGPWDFDAFLDLLHEAEALLASAGVAGLVQLASFHPRYQFAGEAPAALSNYTNRSPYPTVHLLRESMMTRALAGFPDPQNIPARNIARLQAMGREGVEELWGFARPGEETE